jgi:ClpP class serine protease
MRSLIKAISANRPFLVDYSIAEAHIEAVKKHGFTDLLAQFFGPAPKPYAVGSTFVIPIYGMIGKGLSPIDALGASDVETVSDWIDQAVAAKPARIVFDINSDGGTTEGVEELADKIRSLGIETIAYSSGSMNSAAYWIASASDRVLASGSASVGSIGVYMCFMDQSAAAAAAGIKPVVISSGPLKAMGIPGTSLTEPQAAYLQAEVDAIATDFKAAIKLKRSLVNEEDMQGQSMQGKVAAAKNIVTGLAPSLKDLLASLEGGPIQAAEGPTARNQKKPKAQAARLTSKAAAQEAEPMQPEAEAEDGLTARQRYLADELEGIAETFGDFDKTSGPDGAHYVEASPFVDQGLICQNCVFYKGPRGCSLVEGDIDPNAICKLWVIPGALVKE